MHAAPLPESSVQLKVQFGLLEVKEKLAVVWLLGLEGASVMVTTGGAAAVTVTVAVAVAVSPSRPVTVRV